MPGRGYEDWSANREALDNTIDALETRLADPALGEAIAELSEAVGLAVDRDGNSKDFILVQRPDLVAVLTALTALRESGA